MKTTYPLSVIKFAYLPFLVFILGWTGCQKNEERLPTPLSAQDTSGNLLSREQLDKHIQATLLQTGKPFDWNTAPLSIAWSGVVYSEYTLSIGYQPDHNPAGRKLNQLDLQALPWRTARNQVISLLLEEERKVNPSLTEDQLLRFPEFGLPALCVVIKNPATLSRLRHSVYIRYAEPMGYEPAFTKAGYNLPASRRASGNLGCGENSIADASLQSGIDFTQIAPLALRSWNYTYHNILLTWEKDGGTVGQGIGVAIFDTGLSLQQNNLNGDGFYRGVPGRIRVAKSTLPNEEDDLIQSQPESYDDPCGHGTALAGVIAGPRSDVGAMVGVAYGCNLYAYRVTNDVYLDSPRELFGVASAYLDAAQNADIHIISMSLGRVGKSSLIADAIRYAYENGKMVFCAAGTIGGISWLSGIFADLNNLVFPANMDDKRYGKNIVLGVSGITTSYKACSNCVVGSATDFVVVMQRSFDETNGLPLGMPLSGDEPTTIGGSSVGTATLAGMAALIWSSSPSQTREQVLERLQKASSFYPDKDRLLGWGLVDTYQAVDGPLASRATVK